MLQGPIVVTGKGVGYFVAPDSEEHGDYEIAPEEIKTALNGDIVEIEPLGKELYGKRQARVTEVVLRKKLIFVGTLEQVGDDYFFLIPDDKRLYRDIFIHQSLSRDGKHGDKAQVRITEWKDAGKSPQGEVLRIIGKAGEHNAEMTNIVL